MINTHVLYFLRLGKMVDKEKIMEEGMKKYFLQKAVISNEGTKVKQTIFLMINCIYYLIFYRLRLTKLTIKLMMKIHYT